MYSRQLYRTGQLMNMHEYVDLAEIPAIILPLSTTSPRPSTQARDDGLKEGAI